MMRSPRQFLFASTVAGIFSSAVIIQAGFDFQLWYAVMACNLVLLVWLGAVRFRPGMWLLVAAMLASGAVGYLQRSNTPALFAKQFLGIAASAFYFSCYYHLAGDDAALCFRHYVRAAYYVSIAGIALLIVQLPAGGEFPRLQSVLSEPSMFALVTLPAAYYSLDRYRTGRTYGRELAVFAAALLLSRLPPASSDCSSASS
jgi:hypothetical protein